MDEIKWKIEEKTLKKFSEIWHHLFKPAGEKIIVRDAEKSLNGDYSILEKKKHVKIEKIIFGKSYTKGYLEGFQRGFKEGAKAMEVEISDDK